MKYVQAENGRMIAARDFGKEPTSAAANSASLVLSDSERAMIDVVREIWARILNVKDLSMIDEEADFFKMGAGL